MSDEEFFSRFEEGSLPLDAFHHQDHVRMAFLYLQRYAPLEAIRNFSEALGRFAAVHGKHGLYNETITWALLLLIREWRARASRPQSWEEFAAANPDLMSWQNNVLKKYYRPETLSSELAKATFLFPDQIDGCSDRAPSDPGEACREP